MQIHHFASLFSSPPILYPQALPSVSVRQYGSIIRIDLPAQQFIGAQSVGICPDQPQVSPAAVSWVEG